MAEKKKDKEKSTGLGFDIKTAVVAVIAIIAIFFVASFMLGKEMRMELEYFKGELANSSAFSQSLASANKVYIVMDLREANETQRLNIMQCGTDFAGSEGLVNKEITTYALEKDVCTTLEGMTSIETCVNNALNNGIGFYIYKGNSTYFFKDKAIVGAGGNYQYKNCDISVK